VVLARASREHGEPTCIAASLGARVGRPQVLALGEVGISVNYAATRPHVR
jgi:hypothetical protein